ncbi:MAG: hypothetical protein O2968_06965 [Acidobacteria bacterium]|nr:hypothetical protein [Acidobacteriota bacterium]
MTRRLLFSATRTLLAGILFSAGILSAQLSDQQTRELFTEASQLFRQANESANLNPAESQDLYHRAVLRFERIVSEGGVRNGMLFYNIGNAYFRINDIGRAILNYRRAEQYIPGDPNLSQNLRSARESRQDTFEEGQSAQVIRMLLFWHYDFTPRFRSILFGFLSLVFWGLASLRFFRPAWAPTWSLALLGCLATLFFGSLAVEFTAQASQQAGVLVAPQVIARKGDGLSYEPAFTDPLHAGTEFVQLQARDDWRYIELPDGRQCWVPVDAAEMLAIATVLSPG